ncbi:heme oxygenase (biliverdin-producing) [Brevibacterium spongiae]|uniref:Biliverdin-producing heme oxygenase n=1 Tax=Brevibacterium spongiae TaxID=2909672 RepID=A0ABY5SQZ4_9MICO|nr:biliverdin-producing heme oxygenase [Brevibacterium spongiae]UVI35134.1 biliverdin-producing heme oxygenase [Brevibacterium spongiae]
MSEQFSARLKASTAAIHDEVEHTTFMVDLMEGRLDSRAYALLLRQYQAIYSVLESTSRQFADDPVFAPFHDVNLFRSERIAADLTALDGSDLPVMPSADAYAARLAGLERAEQVIAHHYTRYLGDLSGGQAIDTLMGRHYGLGTDALTMWDFAEIGKTKPYKDAYRRLLDEVAATGGDEQIVIDETMVAFRLNGALLVDLTEATEERAVPVG